jgi:chromosome segregation ATPase
MATERNMLATELSASRKQHQQLIASLDQERGSLVVAQENTQKRLTQSEQEKSELERVLQETEAALESERQKAAQAQNDLNNQFHTQAQQIEQQHNSQIESLKSELVETRKLLADLRTASAEERDSLVGQRDEIQRTLSSEKSALETKIAELEAAHAAELKSERETLERQFHEDRTLLDERLSTVEQERTTLEASLKEVADYERTVSALRSERDNAIAALASAERIHSTALIESEQRYRDGLAAPARELEQIRLNAETIQAELIVARKMHVEVVGTIEKEREQFASLKADWERRLESVDEARRQVSARLDDREQAIGLLEEKIRLSEASLEKQNADIAELRNNLDAARRENEQLCLRSAATERQLREEIAALTQKIELISSEKQGLASRIEHLETSHRQELEKSAEELRNANAAREHLRIALENERDQVKLTAETEKSELSTALEAKLEQAKNTLAGEREQLRKALEAERDSLRAELNSERATKQTEFAAIAREREEALRTAATEVARIEQELSRTREQRDIFKREKEELTRRIALATEQQKRMLDDIAAGLGHTPPSAPRPPASSVFEVSPDDGNINLPRVRPVQIRPPQVKVL